MSETVTGNYLIHDIETIPEQNLQEHLKPKFNKSTVKLGNLKDEKKIAEKIEIAAKSFENGLTKKMSIESNFCQILSIGYIEIDSKGDIVNKGVIFNESGDRDIISEFNKVYNGQTLVGWNSKSFDIPIIWKRAIINGVKNPFVNYRYLTNKYNDNSIDLMHIWNGADKMGKMIDCAARLGIPAKTGLDGSMIYDAYKEKRFDEIKEYNLEDCECTLAIFKKLYLV